MPNEALFHPVTGNEVPKVDDAISVGEDLAFQERWWRFETVIWWFFALVLLADVLGAFGRGWLSKAKLQQPGSGMSVDYERVERNSTPSIMRITLGPEAIQNGEAHLFASESLVRQLGMNRVIPQPEHSSLADGGIVYTFPARGQAIEVQFALEPSFPGYHAFTLQVPGQTAASAHVVVVP